MITPAHVRSHLPHQVTNAPHLVVCVCGELSYAVPGEATATEVWADHLAKTLNVALAGTGGPA